MAELSMSVREAAARTGWSKDLIYDLVRKSQIPFIRVGTRKVSIPKEPFEKWLAEKALSNMKTSGQETQHLQAVGQSSSAPFWKTKPGCGGRKRKQEASGR